MFSRATDASKVALVHLVWRLQAMKVQLMDCQQETRHTSSLGARAIPRTEFKLWLEQLTRLEPVTPFAPT
jgi:leucyl/phenylalanyl-tRNA--protein transferase